MVNMLNDQVKKHAVLGSVLFSYQKQLFLDRFSQWMTVPSLITQRGPRNVLWQLSKRRIFSLVQEGVK